MIESEITRITEGKQALRTAIRAKSGGVQPTPNQSLDDYSSIINNIDLGGVMTDEVKAIVNRTATTVTVPATVTELRVACFMNCTQLQEIVMIPTTPPTQGLDWCENTNNCTIYVPDDSVTTYRNSWSDLSSRIQPLSSRPIIYDFTNATTDNEAIQTYESNSRTIVYLQFDGVVKPTTGYLTTEYDGLYLQSPNIWFKRIGTYNGLYQGGGGNRGLSIDTKGYNTITLNNGSSTAWTSDSLPYVEGGTLSLGNDGMSATITVNEGVTKVDITVTKYVCFTSFVFSNV